MTAKIRIPTTRSLPPETKELVRNIEIEIDKGDRKQVRRISAAYQARTEDFTIAADAAGGAFTVTLPANGYLNVKKVDATANVVTINGGGLLIDGLATKAVSASQQCVTMHGDGVSWMIV